MTPQEENLIAQIESAFSGVTLEDGDSLNMTEYWDSGGSVNSYAEKAKEDERNDWRNISDSTLERFRVTFSFTDLKGYRFYLPAYMRWTVRNHRISDSPISDSAIHAIDPTNHHFLKIAFIDWFTEEQIDLMKRFLEYTLDQEESFFPDWARTNLIRITEAQQGTSPNRA